MLKVVYLRFKLSCPLYFACQPDACVALETQEGAGGGGLGTLSQQQVKRGGAARMQVKRNETQRQECSFTRRN